MITSLGKLTFFRLLLVGCALATASFAPAREADFNRGWKFMKGDPDGASESVFNDVSWQTVRTPHDWAIAGPFDPEVEGHSGKLPWRGVGWYRKWLMLGRQEAGSRVYLDFDGVMASPEVYVNGERAGAWDYGYTPFRVEITDQVRFGRSNLVAVRVDTTKMKTRWYSGAGIYRKVTLTVSPPVHLAHDGTFVTTPEIADNAATVVVTNEVESHLAAGRPTRVVVRLRNPAGESIAESSVEQPASAEATDKVRHEFTITNPQRWDTESPLLYRADTELIVDNHVVERRSTPFGVRSYRFTPDDGFWLNGRRVELRGVNLHHDLGPLGAAFNRSAAERQLRIMQGMGANAIRTAHNPPAAELLDLCDELGLLVWDELFDKWDETSGRVDGEPAFEDHVRRHAASFVRRDRNHPSVIVWSIGNEIINQPYAPEGKSRERIRFAREAFLEHDPTRPVGLGCFIPDTALDDTLADLDLTGWNYQRRYALFREHFPKIPIVYSESASTVSSRGRYQLPLPDNKCDFSTDKQVTAYELASAPWADIPEVEFERLRQERFVTGEFVWTGFDYLGEPTPFTQDARSSYFGIVDLVGLPKDRYYLYRSLWRADQPTVHLAPHWNWPNRVGKPVPVMVYTNGDSAELFLNGKSLGKRRKGERPAQPTELTDGAVASASSHAPESSPDAAIDAAIDAEGRSWVASSNEAGAWLQVDLDHSARVKTIAIRFPRESKHYGYRLLTRLGEDAWTTIDTHPASEEPRWGGVQDALHRADIEASAIRIEFDQCLDGTEPAIEQLTVYDGPYESSYFDPTYDYRLRWNDVLYEPGELRAVAYRDGEPLGEATVNTAGAPARLRLEADRDKLRADGLDTAFVTITAVDEQGVACPLADHRLTLSATGAGELAGADAGDPTSLDPLQDNQVCLFSGKAVAVVRTHEDRHGPIEVLVESPGLPSAKVSLQSER